MFTPLVLALSQTGYQIQCVVLAHVVVENNLAKAADYVDVVRPRAAVQRDVGIQNAGFLPELGTSGRFVDGQCGPYCERSASRCSHHARRHERVRANVHQRPGRRPPHFVLWQLGWAGLDPADHAVLACHDVELALAKYLLDLIHNAELIVCDPLGQVANGRGEHGVERLHEEAAARCCERAQVGPLVRGRRGWRTDEDMLPRLEGAPSQVVVRGRKSGDVDD